MIGINMTTVGEVFFNTFFQDLFLLNNYTNNETNM